MSWSSFQKKQQTGLCLRKRPRFLTVSRGQQSGQRQPDRSGRTDLQQASTMDWLVEHEQTREGQLTVTGRTSCHFAGSGTTCASSSSRRIRTERPAKSERPDPWPTSRPSGRFSALHLPPGTYVSRSPSHVPFQVEEPQTRESALNSADVSILNPVSRTRSPGCVTVRELATGEVDSDFIARWARLESESLEGNAFLSPGFVLAAAEHLSGTSRPFLVAIENESTGELIGLGVFEQSRGSRLLPLTHLQAWQCEHSFTQGLLLRSNVADDAVDALFAWLLNNGHRWHGVSFSDRTAESKLDAVLGEAANRAGLKWREDWRTQRAGISVTEVPDDCLTALFSKSRRKSLRRDQRKLESHGVVDFHIHTDDPDGRLLDEFFRLESCGWKGDDETSLASTPASASFCRAWVDSLFESGRVAISELTVGGRAVAMSLNPISSETLFAFKIGWDTNFADCSPGTLCELFLMQSVRQQLPDVRFVDSCAEPGSYVEKVWPWTFPLTSGVFPTTRLGSLAVDSMLRIKQVKRLLRGG